MRINGEHITFNFTGTRSGKIRVRISTSSQSDINITIGSIHFQRLDSSTREFLHEKAVLYMMRLNKSMDEAWYPLVNQLNIEGRARFKATGKNVYDVKNSWEDFV
jgi:hypothetical protein